MRAFAFTPTLIEVNDDETFLVREITRVCEKKLHAASRTESDVKLVRLLPTGTQRH